MSDWAEGLGDAFSSWDAGAAMGDIGSMSTSMGDIGGLTDFLSGDQMDIFGSASNLWGEVSGGMSFDPQSLMGGIDSLLGGGMSGVDAARAGTDVMGWLDKALDWVLNPKNAGIVNLGANIISGMLTAPLVKKQAAAQEKVGKAAMMNAKTNQGALALKEQQLANGSSIKNTNFGTAMGTGLMYKDLLSERRARNL